MDNTVADLKSNPYASLTFSEAEGDFCRLVYILFLDKIHKHVTLTDVPRGKMARSSSCILFFVCCATIVINIVSQHSHCHWSISSLISFWHVLILQHLYLFPVKCSLHEVLIFQSLIMLILKINHFNWYKPVDAQLVLILCRWSFFISQLTTTPFKFDLGRKYLVCICHDCVSQGKWCMTLRIPDVPDSHSQARWWRWAQRTWHLQRKQCSQGIWAWGWHTGPVERPEIYFLCFLRTQSHINIYWGTEWVCEWREVTDKSPPVLLLTEVSQACISTAGSVGSGGGFVLMETKDSLIQSTLSFDSTG